MTKTPVSNRALNFTQVGGSSGRLSSHGADGGRALVFADEFNGPAGTLPNAANWNCEVGYVRNQEKQYYALMRPENMRLSGNSTLLIEARHESYGGMDYSSASLTTIEKHEFLYGLIEVRAKLPPGRGTWPGIWLQGVTGSWPARGEIDIMEYVGFESNQTHSNVWTTSIQANQYGTTNAVTDVSAWHVYSLDWTPTYLKTYVDGVLCMNFPKLSSSFDDWPFDTPQQLMLNLAIGGVWGGSVGGTDGTNGIDNSIFASQVAMEVDYVRHYQQV